MSSQVCGMNPTEFNMEIELRAVIYHDQDTGRWVGHCLEMDIVGEGDTPQMAAQEVMDLCDTQIIACIENRNLDDIFSPAPSEIFTIYAQARNFVDHITPPTRASNIRVKQYAQAA